MNGIRDGHRGVGSRHLFVQRLLLHLLQLLLQVLLVDLVAHVDVVHSLDDFVAERVLLAEFLPVDIVSSCRTVVHHETKYGGGH